MSWLGVISIIVLGYFMLLEAQQIGLAISSYVALARDRRVTVHGRVADLLQSDATPPVSIIMPAFNEQAGIVDAVRSMTLLSYPRLQVVVVNDGSTDDTLAVLEEAFSLEPVDMPIRPQLTTQPIKQVYVSALPIPVVVVDKENGGKGDAINAGINVARYPYFLATDADIIIDEECLLRTMRHFVQDRARTIAVGGNVRPLNGSSIESGRVGRTGLPSGWVELVQVVEYVRSFLAARPGWSLFNSLILVSGAFGVFRKDAVIEAGGYAHGHLGEDLELTMRLHRTALQAKRPYRVVYAADAVAWTEVPVSVRVLRRQRIRWHRGLMQTIGQYKSMLFNPRYGRIGLVAWPGFVAFEFLAPVIEFLGWLLIPMAIFTGNLDFEVAILLLLGAFLLGTLNSLIGLAIDERFGYFNRPREALKLLAVAIPENFGSRQLTVWWRVRAMFWRGQKVEWGDMERAGVSRVA